jgi:hypothetical protein
VSEVKFKALTTPDRERLKKQVIDKWQGSHLGRKNPSATVEILDTSALAAGSTNSAEPLGEVF